MGLFKKDLAKSFEEAIVTRRSVYHIEPKSPISDEEIESIIAHVVKHVPSAFNSQSTRIVLLLGDNHKILWDITKDSLKSLMGPDRDFSETEQKINSFKAGYGTVLYYIDTKVTEGLQEKFAAYADNFPIWAEQSNAMHQFAIWTEFANKGLGASLQHYNGVIDQKVVTEFDIPETWQLVAQMPFGSIGSVPGPKDFQPVENRFIVKK
ncbi:nitroreductase family protein [Macrococcoides caseolyticum]|uniref:nitroreductase family protein n=1 Tax=Macrococcoides caseolyticum TaxID=69966 RepID=UPI001F3CBD50|nr:nitroreductase family protein [Macrococcus caseolyticus]MCE4958024.1 nitroreductase family protein [Macrococcus caseolyticus]